MQPNFLNLAAIAASLLATSASAQNLGKNTLWKGGISPLIDQGLWQYLVPTPSSIQQWPAGTIPQRCADAANLDGLSPRDFDVFSVKYTDCGTPWSFCRHRNAPLSLASMIDLFGRLPVKERQWIQHVVAIPGPNSAYMWAAIVTFKGNVGVPSVFQHEVGHALDFYKGPSQASDRWEFWDAIRQDTCVPDDYANTNNVEDFAQIGVVSMFEIVNPGGLDPAFGWTWHCLLNQITIYNALQRDHMIPGGTCGRRWADSPAIGARGQRVDPSTLPSGSVMGMPGVVELPSTDVFFKTEYGDLVQNETEAKAAEARLQAWAVEGQKLKEKKRAVAFLG